MPLTVHFNHPPVGRVLLQGIFLLLAGQMPAAEGADCARDTLSRLLQSGHLHQSRAEYSQSEEDFQAALVCQKRSLPANDLTIAVTLANLGELKRLQRRFKEAEALLTEAETLHLADARTEHPAFAAVLLSLASVYKDQKQYLRAEPLARQALTVFECASGPGSRDVTAALNTLAVLHAESGDLDGAERHLRRALAGWQDAEGDASIATAQHNLGRILFEKGNLAEAEQWLFRALDLRTRLLGSHHPSTVLTIEACQRLLQRTGRKAEARQLRARSKLSNASTHH